MIRLYKEGGKFILYLGRKKRFTLINNKSGAKTFWWFIRTGRQILCRDILFSILTFKFNDETEGEFLKEAFKDFKQKYRFKDNKVNEHSLNLNLSHKEHRRLITVVSRFYDIEDWPNYIKLNVPPEKEDLFMEKLRDLRKEGHLLIWHIFNGDNIIIG